MNENINISEIKEKLLKMSNWDLEKLIKSFWYDHSVNFVTRTVINSKLKSLSDEELLKLANDNNVDLTKIA